MTLKTPAGVSRPFWPLETGARRIQPVGVVDGDLLAAQRDDGHERLAGVARLDRGYLPLTPNLCGIGRIAGAYDQHQAGHGR